MSDPAKYRTKEELAAYQNQDAIQLLKTQLIQKGHLTEAQYRDSNTSIMHQCDDAVTFAENGKEPALETLEEDVLV